MQEKFYNISVVGQALNEAPADIAYLFLSCNSGEAIYADRKFPFFGPWGVCPEILGVPTYSRIPTKIDVVYLSVIEQKYFYLEDIIDIDKINKCLSHYNEIDSTKNIQFIVGFAPYGKISLWLNLPLKQYLINTFEGIEIEVDMEDFFPNNPALETKDLCKYYTSLIPQDNIDLDDLYEVISKGYFESLMRQYMYRYKLESNTEGKIKYVIDYLYTTLFDGTFDKMNTGDLFQFHLGGKPKFINIKCDIGKNEYSIFFWISNKEITRVLDKFYGAHPETKADFIIRIDAENKKYELALYRQGLKEPVVIPESAYQLIVFKNKFEHYRSENYNQPRGAWMW